MVSEKEIREIKEKISYIIIVAGEIYDKLSVPKKQDELDTKKRKAMLRKGVSNWILNGEGCGKELEEWDGEFHCGDSRGERTLICEECQQSAQSEPTCSFCHPETMCKKHKEEYNANIDMLRRELGCQQGGKDENINNRT